MGWSGANSVFDPVAQALIDLGATDEVKTTVLGPLNDEGRPLAWQHTGTPSRGAITIPPTSTKRPR
jgi:hypothetical protein